MKKDLYSAISDKLNISRDKVKAALFYGDAVKEAYRTLVPNNLKKIHEEDALVIDDKGRLYPTATFVHDSFKTNE